MSKKAKNIVVSALLTVIFLALNGLSAPAQEKSAIEKGDSLRRAYCFKAALDTLEAAKLAASDSLEIQRIEEAAMLARNGLNMLGFCNRPVVVAREKFARKDFFLYYPVQDKSWRPVPNALDSLSDGIVPATFIPEGASSLLYSASDSDGIRNLYKTQFADTVWTAPELLGEHLTSSGNEIFPMLSHDGQSLYFASDGLYGMGGYDLYVSKWNSELQEWDTPSNLGFPYSSPYDDFLFVN